MTHSCSITTVLLFAVASSLAQSPSPFVAQADSAYMQGQFAKSATLYAKAIAAGTVRTDVFYNASCSFALAGIKDSAFYYLGKAEESGWRDVNHMMQDADLASLHADPRWKSYVDRAEKASAAKAPLDSLIYQLNYLSMVSYQFRVTPKSKGGGGGAFTGFEIPENLRSTSSGTFSAISVKADTITIVATSSRKNGTVTASINATGRLFGWIYTGEFK